MKRSSKNVVRKKRGRPATGQNPVTAIRLSAEMRKSVDNWAACQTDKPARSEAIRRLVALGLEALPAPVRTTKRTTAKASELAGTAIDWLTDASAPAEEQVKRKRRLVKGPPEFRKMRADVPKAKPGR